MDISVKPARGIVRTLPKAIRGERLVITLTLPAALSGRDFGCEIHSAQAPKDDALIAVFGTAVGAVVTYTITASQMASLDLEGQAEKAFWFVLYSLYNGEGTHHLMGTLTVLEGNVEGIETADPGLSVYTPEAPQDGTTYGRRNGAWVAVGGGGGGGPVSWDDILDTPTTLAGYGITDAAAAIHTHAFSTLTGRPTTLAGYGITDAAAASHTHAFSTLTGKPTTLAGYGITDGVTSAALTAALAGKADLDINGKVASSQLPESLSGGLVYKGTWDPASNTPPVGDVTGEAGWYYICSGDGEIDLGSGAIVFAAGDWIVHNGASYDKLDATDQVSSVAGKTGNVTLVVADITDFDAAVSTTAADGLLAKYSNLDSGVGLRAEVFRVDATPGVQPIEIVNSCVSESTTPEIFAIPLGGTAATREWAATQYAPLGAVTAAGLTMATSKILGRKTAGAGAVEEIGLAGNIDVIGANLNLTQNTGKLIGRTTAGSGASEEITVGSGLSLAAGTLSATGGGGGGTKTISRFRPFDADFPALDFPTFVSRNGRSLLRFARSATNQVCCFGSVIPQGADISSGIKVRLFCMSESATSGVFRMGAQFERCTTDMDSDSFDSATEGNATTSGTSGIITILELTCTNLDGLSAGDPFVVKIYRDGSDSADTMTAGLDVFAVELQQVA